VDFRHLRAFIAVAEESSVTRAAGRLHISQPPLSRHIRQLEAELGVTLFTRHRHGVTLTDTGRQLLEKARGLAAAAADFYEAAGAVTREDSRRIRVGIGWGLWDAVNRVRVKSLQASPGLSIDATDVHCAEQYNAQLRDNALDVVFARPPFDAETVETAPLFCERILAVLSEDHPLAGRDAIRLHEIADEPLLLWDRHIMPVLYDKILELYANAGLRPKSVPTPGAGPFNHAGMMLVASGKGVYLCIGVPQTSPQPAGGVAVVPVADPGATIEIAVAWRKGDTSPRVAEFLECVWQVFPRMRPMTVTVRTPSRRAS
jgi:DNA-binding transcriptional LysR family regulator